MSRRWWPGGARSGGDVPGTGQVGDPGGARAGRRRDPGGTMAGKGALLPGPGARPVRARGSSFASNAPGNLGRSRTNRTGEPRQRFNLCSEGGGVAVQPTRNGISQPILSEHVVNLFLESHNANDPHPRFLTPVKPVTPSRCPRPLAMPSPLRDTVAPLAMPPPLRDAVAPVRPHPVRGETFVVNRVIQFPPPRAAGGKSCFGARSPAGGARGEIPIKPQFLQIFHDGVKRQRPRSRRDDGMMRPTRPPPVRRSRGGTSPTAVSPLSASHTFRTPGNSEVCRRPGPGPDTDNHEFVRMASEPYARLCPSIAVVYANGATLSPGREFVRRSISVAILFTMGENSAELSGCARQGGFLRLGDRSEMGM